MTNPCSRAGVGVEIRLPVKPALRRVGLRHVRQRVEPCDQVGIGGGHLANQPVADAVRTVTEEDPGADLVQDAAGIDSGIDMHERGPDHVRRALYQRPDIRAAAPVPRRKPEMHVQEAPCEAVQQRPPNQRGPVADQQVRAHVDDARRFVGIVDRALGDSPWMRAVLEACGDFAEEIGLCLLPRGGVPAFQVAGVVAGTGARGEALLGPLADRSDHLEARVERQAGAEIAMTQFVTGQDDDAAHGLVPAATGSGRG